MKQWRIIILLVLVFTLVAIEQLVAQCSICTKTAMQQGQRPAEGMNSGVLYLMLAPFTVVGYIGYRWWKSEKADEAFDATASE